MRAEDRLRLAVALVLCHCAGMCAGRGGDGLVEHFDSWPLPSAWHGEAQDLSRIRIVKEPARRGAGALRVTVRPGDIAARRERAEVTLQLQGSLESEALYRWSILIPEDYRDDPDQRRFQIMGQFHVVPDWGKGEGWDDYPGVPPMVSVQYGADEEGPGLAIFYGLEGKRKRIEIQRIEKGRWYDIALAIRWSRTDRGYVEGWIDGKPWTPWNGSDHRYYGANMYNDVPPLLKLGLYRDFGFKTENSVYYDELQIAPAAARER